MTRPKAHLDRRNSLADRRTAVVASAVARWSSNLDSNLSTDRNKSCKGMAAAAVAKPMELEQKLVERSCTAMASTPCSRE